MDIKGYLSRLFKTKELGMISLNDMAYIPNRNELNSELVKSLDEYKEKYKEILLQDKYITSHDISSKDYSDDMIMNFYLFNRLIINQDEVYNLDTMEEYKRNELYLKYKINPYKILLYIDKMEEIYNETLLRLIALKEIVNELELDKNKIDAIKNEIDTLTTHYIIFKNNLYAALMEINNLKNSVNYQFDKYDEHTSHEMISDYENELLEYVRILIPDKLDEEELKLPIMNRLAYLESELEMYCYHFIDVDRLNEELQEIDKIEKTVENREYLLQRINELALRYEVLNRYGGYELDLKPLYEVKFDILTIDIVRQKDSPFNSISDRELSYYKDIIFDILVTNITGVDSLLSQRLPDDKKYLIQYFVGLLKYSDIDLSSASDELMNYFFNNYQIDFNDYSLLFNFARAKPSIGITMKDKVPLGTVCWINHLNISIKKNGQGFINEDTLRIVEIYNYFHNKENENSLQYKIPEGITFINTLFPRDGYLITKEILELSNEKTLVMPSSLKTLKLRTGPKGEQKSCVILNEGLENISESSLIGYMTRELTIPSTLQDAYDSVLVNVLYNPNGKEEDNLIEMEELTFTNCEESITLHDSKQLDKIIMLLCESVIHSLRLKFEYPVIINPSNIDLEIKPCNIILVYKNGDEKVISIDSIAKIEVLQKIKQLYTNNGLNIIYYGSNFIIDDLSYFFDSSLEDKIIINIKNEIDEVLVQHTEQKVSSHK